MSSAAIARCRTIEVMLAPIIRGGRAIFSVELEGFLGRPYPPDWVQPSPALDEYVDYNIQRVTEMRRGVDDLEPRPDIDRTRVALCGLSAGGGPGVFVTALDSRYRSVMFAGTDPGRGGQIYEGAHTPTAEILIPALTKWFDETMGPVEH